jgi:hypothetical protein
MLRETQVWEDHFDRAQVLAATPGQNGWQLRDTSAAGAPTALCASADGGALLITLANTAEAEFVTAYHGDVLNFRLDKLQRVTYNVKVSGIDAVSTLVFGVASAARTTHAEVPDNEAFLAWFRMEGSASTSLVVVETDDAVRDNNDIATGVTLSSTYKRCTIDFSYGLADVRFIIDDKRVAGSTTFNMSATPSQRCQPYIDLSKASGTGIPAVSIDKVELVYNIAN